MIDPEHQRGAEVRLQEDERSRCQAEAEVAHRALPLRAAPGAIDDEPGKRKHEQELAELRWLEAEEGKFEGAPRAARGEAEDEDQRDADAEEGVDADPQLAEARVVDAGQQVHADDAEHGVDRLPVDVVVGVAGDVVLRRLAEREDAEGGQGDGGEGQRAVHVGQAEALGDAGADREGLGPGAGGRGSRTSVGASAASALATSVELLVRNTLRGSVSAAGAADSAPKPPSSMVTKVTIRGFGIRGEDRVPGLVRVRRALGGAGLAGDRDREAAEDVDTRCRRRSARRRAGLRGSPPGMSGSMWTWRARLGVEFLQHPAGGVVDLHADVRGDDGAAVAERRVGDRHLQRVGLQVALPGGELDVVAGRPGPVGFAFLVELVAPVLASGSRPSSAPGRSMPVGRPIPSACAQCCSSPVSHMRRPSV